jgi:aminoglycoside phosphotransferase (APT) family kinase protein
VSTSADGSHTAPGARQSVAWNRVLLTPSRIQLWSTPGRGGAAAASVLYQPRRRHARLASALAGRASPLGRRRTLRGPSFERVTELAGVRYDAAAALHVHESDRWLFALLRTEGSGVVVKIGGNDDRGLRTEAALLTELAGTDAAFTIPTLRSHAQFDAYRALVTDILKRRTKAVETSLEDALLAAIALAATERGFVVHGDLAPWNIVPVTNGIALVDWEAGRIECDPLFDLSHYVTRAGALLRAWEPGQAVGHLTDRDSVGWRYLVAIGHDPRSATEHVSRYLRRDAERSAASVLHRYEAAMVEGITNRRAAPRSKRHDGGTAVPRS